MHTKIILIVSFLAANALAYHPLRQCRTQALALVAAAAAVAASPAPAPLPEAEPAFFDQFFGDQGTDTDPVTDGFGGFSGDP
jgi:hypothetical protein